MRFINWPLRAKFAALLIAASLVPLGIVSYVDLREAEAQRLEHLHDLLQARGDQIVRELDDFHERYSASADRIATFSDVVAYCVADAPARTLLAGPAVRILRVYPTGDGSIRGVALIDPSGHVALSTEQAMIGVDLSRRSAIIRAAHGERVISEIYVDVHEASDTPTIAYLASVPGPDGAPACVVALWVRAEALWTAVRASNALAGKGSFAVIFDRHGIRIAHTYSDDIVFHPAGRLDAGLVDALVAEGRFGATTRALLEDVRPFPEQFERARAAAPSASVFRGFAPVNRTWNYGVGRRISAVPWTVFYMVPESEYVLALADLKRKRIEIAALAMLIAGAIGMRFSRGISQPLLALTVAASSIAAGNPGARVGQKRTDEIGRLSADFDAMVERIEAQASELQRGRIGLEERVAQRTADLTKALDRLASEAGARAQLETELLAREAELRRAQAIAKLAHVVVRADGSFGTWSETLPLMTGLDSAQVPRSARRWLRLVHPDDRGRFRAKWTAAATDSDRVDIGYRLRHASRGWIDVHQVNEPIAGRSGARGPTDWFCTLQDVTELRGAERDLRESELRFRQMAETIEDVFWICTPDLRRIVYVSPGFERVWGRPLAAVGADVATWPEWVHPADREGVAQAVRAEGSPPRSSLEYRIVRPDGETRWILDRGFPVINEAGDVTHIIGVASDITDRKRADGARRRLADLVESSDDAIIGKTLDGVITNWNPAAERLFGHVASEVIGRSLRILIPPDRDQEEPQILAQIARGERVDHFETVRVHKDGHRIDISATISPIRDDHGRVVGASKIARDITERNLAEKKLREQLDRLKLLDQISSAMAERQDLRSIYQVVVRSLEECLPADFACVLDYDDVARSLTVADIGLGTQGVLEGFDPAEREAILIDANGLARCTRGDLVYEPDTAAVPFPFPQRLARGGLHSLVLAPLRSESRVFGVLAVGRRPAHAISSGECEFLRQLSAHVALASQQASLYEALQRAYDELRQTQQTVMQQERLRALGQMASGIAHDINNAISPIMLYTEALLEQEVGLSERARGFLQTISRSIDDVAATVARLREFYRRPEVQLDLRPIDVNELLRQVSELTRARWSDMPQQRGRVVRLVSDLASGVPAFLGVESELREALINLVLNAVDAMPEGGVLTLKTSLGEDAPERQVHIDVIDTGIGMDAETRRRCVEPFFTTKGERGTGLGLAMVYGIVRRHDAEIGIDSAPGLGTRVRLSFAAAQASPLPSGALEAPARLDVRLRILVVDDDPVLLTSLRGVLETEGHSVTCANGGQAGIDAFNASLAGGSAFDVVITDLGMPYVDGRRVAAAVKRASESTPVILVTGWGQRLIAEDDIPPHVDRVLPKPPKLAQLRAALAQLAKVG